MLLLLEPHVLSVLVDGWAVLYNTFLTISISAYIGLTLLKFDRHCVDWRDIFVHLEGDVEILAVEEVEKQQA